MPESGAPPPLDALASLFDEWKYGQGKNFIIVRSSSAIVSVAASALLVWIIFRSRDGTKTTYHRLLLGLSISDILLSSSQATFGAVVPSELSYAVWNAQGSQASCDAFGFIQTLGVFSGLLYMCSLNLYYLAKVKFDKTDFYIKEKLEPWLHGVPTLYALIVSIILLVKQRMNADIRGYCGPTEIYEPPHCIGHEDGDTPEGFEIPCGRGRSAQLIIVFTGFITAFLVPITIGGSLWTIYRSVSRAERTIAQYSAGALHINRAEPTAIDASTTNVAGGGSGGGRAFTILSVINRRFGGRASSNNWDSSHSRTVLHRAAAYSVGYLVTWIWTIIYACLVVAGAWPTDFPQPRWQIAYQYMWIFFTPLQGLWTFLIYIQPNVIKRKSSSDGKVSWFRAFADALWSAVTGGDNSARRGRNQAGPGAPRTAAATGRRGANPNPAPVPEGRNNVATIGSTDRQGNFARAESVGLDAEDAEKEKREVQECDEAEVEPCPHGFGRDDEAVSPGTNKDPRRAAAPGAEGPGESSLSSYHSEMETGSNSYFSTRETLSSYFSTRETFSSYFSTGETFSSYYSASETKSDGSTVGSADRRSSGTNPTPAPGAEGIRENRLVRPRNEDEKREMEPCDKEDGEDDEAAAGVGTVVGDGYESFGEYLFGSSDPQGADTVVGVRFDNFLAYLRGRSDPQGGLAREISVGLGAEGAEEEKTKIEEFQPSV